MKKHIAIILVCIVGLVTCNGWTDVDSQRRTITVSGDAEIKVKPDEVVLTLGVETYDASLDTAKNNNDQRVERVLKLAKKFNIEKKHVQTSQINVNPHYRDNPPNLQGYYVRKTIVLVLKKPEMLEDVLTDALKEGANYVHGVTFRTTELRKHRDAARSLALKAAKEKAVDMGVILEQDIGLPITINEGRGGYQYPYNWWGWRGGGMMAQNVIQTSNEGGSIRDVIALGQISVNATVTVTFELKSQKE